MSTWFRATLYVALMQFISPYEGEHLGCYVDKSDRIFQTAFQRIKGNSRADVINSCIFRCRRGYETTFAGIEAGLECFCSNNHNYSIYGEAPASECNWSCGDSTDRGGCGGSFRIDIYTVCRSGYYRNPIGLRGNCDFRCHCKDQAICQYSQGSCPSDGCETEWTGSHCEFRDCSTNNGGCQQRCRPNSRDSPCYCAAGYKILEQEMSACTDIDECHDDSPDTSKCHRCQNTLGSYRCTCNSGYKLSESDTLCSDIDECTEGTTPCEGPCINTPGSYYCNCSVGYDLVDRYKCQDIDECMTGVCQHKCTNTIGGYRCECNIGYRKTGISSCVDIDECADSNGGCSHICNNTIGSFLCSCPTGFNLDSSGMTCQDIDECASDFVVCEHKCVNKAGTFTCTCHDGFYGMGQKKCHACDAESFGENCTGTCHCKDKEPCRKTDGYCSEGCENGWIGSSCDQECWSQFELRLDETSGLSSKCTSITFLERVSIEQCKREACRLKGNVINQRPNACDIRNCTDTHKLEYTADKGGWDVYALPEEEQITSEPSPTTSQILTKSKGKARVIVPAVLVPLLVILIAAIVIGVYIYKYRQQSTNHIRQSSNEDIHAAVRPVSEYENTAFDVIVPQEQDASYEEGQYEVITTGRPSDNYEDLDLQTRQTIEEPYDRMQ